MVYVLRYVLNMDSLLFSVAITMWIPVFLLSTKSSLEQNLVRLSQNIYLAHAIVKFLSSVLFDWTRFVLEVDCAIYPWYHQCVTTFTAYSVKILNPIILIRHKAFIGRGEQVLMSWYIAAMHAGGRGDYTINIYAIFRNLPTSSSGRHVRSTKKAMEHL